MKHAKSFSAAAAVLVVTAAALLMHLAAGSFAGGIVSGGKAGGVPVRGAGGRVYVGGAVIEEGFYEVAGGMTYRELFALTGLFTNSSLGAYDYDRFVKTGEDVLVNFVENGNIIRCADINAATEIQFLAAGIPEEIYVKILQNRGNGYGGEKALAAFLTENEYLFVEYRVYCK